MLSERSDRGILILAWQGESNDDPTHDPELSLTLVLTLTLS